MGEHALKIEQKLWMTQRKIKVDRSKSIIFATLSEIRPPVQTWYCEQSAPEEEVEEVLKTACA